MSNPTRQDDAALDEPIEAILVDTDDNHEPTPNPGPPTPIAASSCS